MESVREKSSEGKLSKNKEVKEVPELNHTLVGYSGGVSVASALVPGLDLGIKVLFTLKQNLTWTSRLG